MHHASVFNHILFINMTFMILIIIMSEQNLCWSDTLSDQLVKIIIYTDVLCLALNAGSPAGIGMADTPDVVLVRSRRQGQSSAIGASHSDRSDLVLTGSGRIWQVCKRQQGCPT